MVARRSRSQRGLVNVADRSTLFHDVQQLSESILDDPPDSASFEAWVTLGNPIPSTPGGKLLGRDLRDSGAPVSLIRMNPLVRPRRDEGGRWLPSGGLSQKEFARLTNVDLDARVPREVQLIVKFARAWLDDDVANQPIRENPYTFEPRIGHTRFSQALKAWRMREREDVSRSRGSPEDRARRSLEDDD